MPVIKRRKAPLRESTVTITGDQISHLLSGLAWRGAYFPFRDENHRRECWENNRSYLLKLGHEHEGGTIRGFSTLVSAPPAERLPQAFYDYENAGKHPASGRKCKHYAEMWGADPLKKKP